MKLRHLGMAAALTATPLALTSSLATAASTQVGDATAPTYNCGNTTATVVQMASAGNAFTLPSNGVVTSVRYGAGPDGSQARSAKIYRPSTNTIVASSPQAQATSGSQSVRLSVKAGDQLGVGVIGGGYCLQLNSSPNDLVSIALGDSAAGSTFASAGSGSARISIAATLESDADGDGYGDSTQDQCPTQVISQSSCVVLGKPGGKAKVGKKLTAPVVAVPSGFTSSYQWFRITKKSKHHKVVIKAVGGATGAAYKAKRKDKGSKLFVRITLTSAGVSPSIIDSASRRVR